MRRRMWHPLEFAGRAYANTSGFADRPMECWAEHRVSAIECRSARGGSTAQATQMSSDRNAKELRWRWIHKNAESYQSLNWKLIYMADSRTGDSSVQPFSIGLNAPWERGQAQYSYQISGCKCSVLHTLCKISVMLVVISHIQAIVRHNSAETERRYNIRTLYIL